MATHKTTPPPQTTDRATDRASPGAEPKADDEAARLERIEAALADVRTERQTIEAKRREVNAELAAERRVETLRLELARSPEQLAGYTRLEPAGAVVLIITRWHEDDLAGRLQDEAAHGGEPWEVLSLPAICEEPGDALGRQPGEALWPDRSSLQELAVKRESLGSQWRSAL